MPQSLIGAMYQKLQMRANREVVRAGDRLCSAVTVD